MSGNIITSLVALILAWATPVCGQAQVVREDNANTTEEDVVFRVDDDMASVVLCVWDTGVDVASLPARNVWSNPNEKNDGEDSDGNGFVDDLNGIAFDLTEQATRSLMMPLKAGLKSDGLVSLHREFKGNGDLLTGFASKEASAVLKSSFSGIGNSKKIVQNLIWFGEYSHGTQMANICIAGNPFAKILVVRQQLSHKPPLPSIDNYGRRALAYKRSVQYMKVNSVRVANLSWSRWPRLIYKALKENGVKGTDAELKELAKRCFKLESEALRSAILGAPEILFVTSAGNNAGSANHGLAPQVFKLPNVISVSAVTQEGEVVGFTAEGEVIDVYANGFGVESKTPNGWPARSTGCSAAASNVSNLACKILAMAPSLSTSQLKALIIESASSKKEGDAEPIRVVNPRSAIQRLVDKLKN